MRCWEKEMMMTWTDPEYEVIDLSLKQRIALWRIIIKARIGRMFKAWK